MATGPANQVLLLQGCYFFDSITLLLASLDRGDGDRNSSSCYAAVFIVPHRKRLNNYLQKHLVGLLTIHFNILYNISNFVLASVKCIILIKFESNYPKLMQSVLEKNTFAIISKCRTIWSSISEFMGEPFHQLISPIKGLTVTHNIPALGLPPRKVPCVSSPPIHLTCHHPLSLYKSAVHSTSFTITGTSSHCLMAYSFKCFFLVVIYMLTRTTASMVMVRPLDSMPNLQARLRLEGESPNCWDSLFELQSCTSEVIMFFLNGETHLGPNCCRAIRIIEQQCWPALLTLLGFTPQEEDILRGYCDATDSTPTPLPPPPHPVDPTFTISHHFIP